MSALGISPSREETSSQEINPKVSKTYTFEQKVPIPSYLIAIAGGEVAFAVSELEQLGKAEADLSALAASRTEDRRLGAAVGT